MALFVLSLCPFDISVGVGAFVIGLSQISSFFSYCDIPTCGELYDVNHGATLIKRANVAILIFLRVVSYMM